MEPTQEQMNRAEDASRLIKKILGNAGIMVPSVEPGNIDDDGRLILTLVYDNEEWDREDGIR